MQATIQTTVKRSERKIASNILKGSLGNMIEWFDWYVYASFAIYFSGAFFPANNQTAELFSNCWCFCYWLFHAATGIIRHGSLC